MIRLNKKIIILLSVVTFASGCTKYLEQKPDATKIVPTTVTDLQRLLDDGSTMNNGTPATIEAFADDYFLTPESYKAMGEGGKLYIWADYRYPYKNDWSFGYLPVYNANVCLEQIKKIDKNSTNEADWNNVYGSALFFRSYYFINLLWTYANAYDEATASTELGIALRTGSDFNTKSVRSTLKDSYQKAIADLLEASNYLPNLQSVPLRPSKAAAFGMLARTYLSMRNYDSSYKYSNLALGIKNELLDYNSSLVVSGNVPFQAYPFNKEVIFHSIMNNSTSAKAPTVALIDTVLYSSYSTNDKRRTVFFRTNGKYQRFKGSYIAHATNLFTGIAVDELYLIRAESKVKMGQFNEGMDDLNSLLKMRYITNKFVPLTANNQEEALTIIRQERRKELLMRGLRWTDIKRFNKEGLNITLKRTILDQQYELPPNDLRYAVLIPEDIIAISGMPQNKR